MQTNRIQPASSYGGQLPRMIQELMKLKPRLSNREFSKLLVVSFRRETAKRWDNVWYNIRIASMFFFGCILALLILK